VDVRAVLEHHRDLRQAITRQGPGLLQARQAGHQRFNREGDALLHLQRRVAGGSGVDLHLDVGDVRHSVDRQLLVIDRAQHGHRQYCEHDHPAVADAGLDNSA